MRSSFATLTGRASWSLRARFTLRSLRPNRSLRTCWTSFTALANAPLRPDRPLLSLRTLRSARANGPWRAGLAYGARRTLGPSRRVTASRESEHRHDSGDDQVSVHSQPVARSAGCAEPSNAVKTLQVALSGPRSRRADFLTEHWSAIWAGSAWRIIL